MTTLSPDTYRLVLSENQKLKYLATSSKNVEEDSSLLPIHQPLEYGHTLVMAVSPSEIIMALKRRSTSEAFVCTLQGIVFEDAKRQYHSKLTKLVASNANPLGTQSNVLLAKKALRYRKAMEGRRIVA
ncbi:unnamed protein product [Peronospora belbahrii]|uniref:Uncharacterized protein n=1 Tax=Peronospora belbahrii TaxID=622444 RepID=A0AAU9L374_9STRA|nr:unnamed protein product [Peronospora belbahrii]